MEHGFIVSGVATFNAIPASVFGSVEAGISRVDKGVQVIYHTVAWVCGVADADCRLKRLALKVDG